MGGGVSGCSAAHRLATSGAVDVTLFDWGRAVGGRTSHRLRPEPAADGSDVSLQFDHGAQFFHVDDPTFGALVLPHAERWPTDASRLVLLDAAGGPPVPLAQRSDGAGGLFFGVGRTELAPVRYVARGGMGALVRGMLNAAYHSTDGLALRVYEGSRVASCERLPDGRWRLRGDGLGHEQSTADALAKSEGRLLGEFDELLVADHMAAAMPDWHPCCLRGLADATPRASAALRASLGWDEGVRRFSKIRPLFTCMVAFAREAGADCAVEAHDAPFDAAAIVGSDVLQWACAQRARPHGGARGARGAGEAEGDALRAHRWVLVSTAEFADKCLSGEGLSRAPARAAGAAGAEYVPQTDGYLRADPAAAMLCEFERILARSGARGEGAALAPAARTPLLVKCQRWGAAYCAPDPPGDGGAARAELAAALCEAEENMSVTLCGDYVSMLGLDGSAPDDAFAIQRAALSGIRAAERILARAAA